MKRYLAAFIIILLIILTGCGSSKADKIIGTWVESSGKVELTFSKDGKMTTTANGLVIEGSYSIKDDMITTTILNPYTNSEVPVTQSFDIKNDTLLLGGANYRLKK